MVAPFDCQIVNALPQNYKEAASTQDDMQIKRCKAPHFFGVHIRYWSEWSRLSQSRTEEELVATSRNDRIWMHQAVVSAATKYGLDRTCKKWFLISSFNWAQADRSIPTWNVTMLFFLFCKKYKHLKVRSDSQREKNKKHKKKSTADGAVFDSRHL